MNFKNVKSFGQKTMKELGKRSPVILTALGIGSGIATVVLAVTATIKAVEQVEEEKCLRVERDEPEEMTKKDVVKTVWKTYIPTAVTGTFSIACFIGSCSVHSRRNAALAAAYKISETALISFKDEVSKEVGEKKVKEIQKRISSDRMEQTPVKNTEVIMTNGKGTLCFDSLSGRYFRSDMETIKSARNDVNWILINEMYASLNDFYERIGLPPNNTGERLGWNVNKGTFDIYFDTKITEDGEPCLVITYNTEPRYNYGDLW